MLISISTFSSLYEKNLYVCFLIVAGVKNRLCIEEVRKD